jgi:Ca-activated chloride channel family protein
MSFLNSGRLWLLLAVAALAALYVVLQRRRSRYAVRFTNLALLDKLAPARPGWRRHMPAGLFLAMLALLVVGFARPVDEVRVPRERATVVVAVDTSASMAAQDVDPNRLAAAAAAAQEFVDGLPEEFNVGLVAFTGGATVVVAPTTDRDALRAGIDRLDDGQFGPQGTAIGEAVDAAVRAIQTLDARAAQDRRRRVSSCCPTGRTRPGASRAMRPPTRRRPGCRSTRSRSAPTAARSSRTGAPSRCRSTARPCGRSPS